MVALRMVVNLVPSCRIRVCGNIISKFLMLLLLRSYFFSPLGHIASAVRHLKSMFSMTAVVRAIHAHLVKSHGFTADGTKPALCRELIERILGANVRAHTLALVRPEVVRDFAPHARHFNDLITNATRTPLVGLPLASVDGHVLEPVRPYPVIDGPFDSFVLVVVFFFFFNGRCQWSLNR